VTALSRSERRRRRRASAPSSTALKSSIHERGIRVTPVIAVAALGARMAVAFALPSGKVVMNHYGMILCQRTCNDGGEYRSWVLKDRVLQRRRDFFTFVSKQWCGLFGANGPSMVLHCNRRTKASKPPRRLRMVAGMTNGKRKAFLDETCWEHTEGRGCPICQKSTGERYIAALAWLHCVREGTARRGMQSDKRAALNGRRGGIAETQGMKRPCDLQNAKRSLRTAAASRAHSSLPSYGPESTSSPGVD